MKKFLVGLIGGIASGKSSALQFFQQQGIDCYSADVIAHQLLRPNSLVYQAIRQHLGAKVLLPNGELNRAYIRQQLLHNRTFKIWLETLMHPKIQQILITKSQASQSPYCVLEIPLLKAPQDYQLQRVLCIDCPEDLQKKRLLARNLSKTEMQGLLELQIPRDQRLALADDVIDNAGTLLALQDQLMVLHQNYLRYSQSGR